MGREHGHRGRARGRAARRPGRGRLTPTQRSSAASSDPALYRRALRLARPYRGAILGVLAAGLLGTPLALLAPVPLKIVVDHVLGGQPVTGAVRWLVPAFARGPGALLWWCGGLVVGVAILGHAHKIGLGFLRTYVGERLVLDFRARLFRHSQRLSLLRHDTAGTSDAIYRIQYDSPAVQNLTLEGPIPLVTSLITIAAMLYVTARLDAQLALAALIVCPVLYFLSDAYRRRLRSGWQRVKSIESSGLSVVQEVMTGLRVVKSFAQEDREQARFLERYRQGLAARIRLTLDEGGFDLAVGVVMAAGTAVVLVLGARHVQDGRLTLGELLLVVGYLAQLYDPLRAISKQVTKLQSSMASAERAFALLDEAPEVVERPGARALARARGEVRYEHVWFAYGTEPVLRDVTFEAPAGARIGVAGRTGSGKTTLVSLLLRLYDPTAGRILLDGVDLRDVRVADLRDQFAIVLQDSVLFSTSIAENIAYARPRASRGEIEAAARAADVHDFIASLPGGYETPVGERGMLLSGGERQRIALARAFLKDAPILMLDEPTSAVDVETEGAIFDAMERLMRDRTTFLIAHRLSTLAGCDLLLVLDDGRLVLRTADVEAALASGGRWGEAARS